MNTTMIIVSIVSVVILTLAAYYLTRGKKSTFDSEMEAVVPVQGRRPLITLEEFDRLSDRAKNKLISMPLRRFALLSDRKQEVHLSDVWHTKHGVRRVKAPQGITGTGISKAHKFN